VQIEAYSLGPCDGQPAVYQRIKVRERLRGKWRQWRRLTAYAAGAYSHGSWCLDAAVHQRTATDPSGTGVTITAYNMDCPTAAGYMFSSSLPDGWLEANGDDTQGGHLWLYLGADEDTVLNAGQADGTFDFARLAGRPAAYAPSVYGE
jgi:hypothetical protein